MTGVAAMDSAHIELGVVSGPVRSFVDPDAVVAFALAINDDNPRYLDGTAVPPTYLVTPALPVVHGLPAHPESVVAAARALVHGEHDIVVHAPVVPGTWVHTTAEQVCAIPTAAGLTVAHVVRSHDDDGALLVEQQWVTVLLGAAGGEARGPRPPDHGFPDAAREQVPQRLTLLTTRDQTFRYAGASTDRNPMHVDDEVARQRGFPRKFNQGLCTLGVATRGLIELAAGNDPTRVRRVAVRFSAPAFPGDSIELAVYDLGETRNGVRAYAFEADAGGATVLRHGRFEVWPE